MLTDQPTDSTAGGNQKRILFLTGTRADFGKLKPLIRVVDDHPDYECLVFVTGMHTLARYGYTIDEVRKAGFKRIHPFMNQMQAEPMDLVLANTIAGLSRFVHEYRPDLIVIHGDRVETLAGAIVGALNNIRTAHVEGGELSGTVDELLRHSVSKLAHLHFVSNDDAAKRLRQLGEIPESIFVIGSPDLDIMRSDYLPDIAEVKKYYEIPFDEFAIVIYHPVTTEFAKQQQYAEDFAAALVESGHNYVVVYPNNDLGVEVIVEAYRVFEGNPRFRQFPSLRFEYFLTLLKACRFIIGNSSAGIREMPALGGLTINVGSRQNNRYSHPTIMNLEPDKAAILDAIARADTFELGHPSDHFGSGDSARLFLEALEHGGIWSTSTQKQLRDA